MPHHRRLSRLILLACLLLLPHAAVARMPTDTYDPYYPDRHHPRLTTPQWFGEPGVEAVVILSIDDMREPEKYEAYLRPILDKLKQHYGRAPLSIMGNLVPPAHPELQAWLAEGLSIECHTRDHPCPLLGGKPLSWSADTYHDCIDVMSAIPGNSPVAFRMPCCDSQNTVSPRFFAEIFSKPTASGRFLQIDSSVFNITTANDSALPRDIVLHSDGRERFRKYVPFKNFVNTIEDYPYPYIIGGNCWEFPCAVPSDWSAQNINKPNSPISLEDMKRGLDAAVLKQGVYTLVFHPHGWIENTQIVELIHHAIATHGDRVRFINFREAAERLNEYLLQGQSLRDGGAITLYDLNNDGYQDVLLQAECRLWTPDARAWSNHPLPDSSEARQVTRGDAWGEGAVLFSMDGEGISAWQFDGAQWNRQSAIDLGGDIHAFDIKDIDGDGTPEMVTYGVDAPKIFGWRGDGWKPWKIEWPATPIPDGITDQGVRLHDIDADGDLDLLYSNEEASGIYLFANAREGWNHKLDVADLPPFVQAGTNRGAFFHGDSIWWQNEDTGTLPDLVAQRTFHDLLKDAEPGHVPPRHAVNTLRLRPGYEAELVASEPLVHDPVSIAWDADGAMWVVEMRDYPNGMDGNGAPGSRVVKLVDTDADGIMDQSTIFMEDLPFADGAMPWRDGVLVTVAPDILFARDTDGDGKADDIEKLFTGFGEGNQQHRINGLRWGLDNWVYAANGDSDGSIRSIKTHERLSISGLDFRFHPDTGAMSTVSGRTQFGRVMNDWGDWFGCANWHPGWHYVLDETQLSRNTDYSPPDTRNELTQETRVYPTSRLVKRFNDFHLANHFTSACGIEIYRDELLGKEYRGNLFTCEPVHNLVSRLVLTPDGATYAGTRPPGEEASEFLSSTDNWFRPVMVRTGPDGALYVADMYRAAIEHPEYINEGDQARTDFRAGSDMGRIYRIYPVGKRSAPPTPLSALDTRALADELWSSNGARRDMAHQRLVELQSEESIASLRALLQQHVPPATHLHAISVLSALHALHDEDLLQALAHEHSAVRRLALRLSRDRLASSAPLRDRALALCGDEDAVKMEAAYAMKDCGTAGAKNLAKMLVEHAADQHILPAALSSVDEHNIDSLLPALAQLMATESMDDDTADAVATMAARFAVRVEQRTLAYVSHLLDASAGARRFHAFSALLQAADGALPASAQPAVDEARGIALDDTQPPRLRAAAAGILGAMEHDRTSDADLLFSLIDARQPMELVNAALDRVQQLSPDKAPTQLLQQWSTYTPALRREIVDQLLSRESGIEAMLSAMEGGAVYPRQIDAAHRQRMLHHRHEEIARRAEAAFAAMANTNRDTVMEQFRQAEGMQPNADHGRVIFAERCAGCHQLAGIGHRVGPDLSAVADRSFDALLVAILDPNRAVEERYTNYTVDTTDFNSYSGVVSAESGSSITLASQNGITSTILRADISSMSASPVSAMPEGLEEGLTIQDFADLIAFVAGNAQPPKQFEGNKPQLVTPDAEDLLLLTAQNAEIYGPTLVYSPEYKNFGNWASEDDTAAWEININHEGEYKVVLEYCCDNNTAGNEYILRCSGQDITGTIHGTGTWNEYQMHPAGKLRLTAAKHRLSFRGKGAPRGTLVELRTIQLEKQP